jgi:TRAP-type C4-dicarboxylate transport system permease small subunit
MDEMRRVYAFLCTMEAVIAGSFLILMVGLIFLGGIARLAHSPLNWTTDVATCLFAWACFLCADIAWRKDGLMSIDLLTLRLSPQAQRVLTFANYLIIGAFLVYLIWAGLHLSYISRARSFQGIAGVSYSWVTMSLPIGAGLLLLTTILKATALARRGDPPAPVRP